MKKKLTQSEAQSIKERAWKKYPDIKSHGKTITLKNQRQGFIEGYKAALRLIDDVYGSNFQHNFNN